MILPIHDEVILELDSDIPVEEASAKIRSAMEQEFGDLKLLCDAEYGQVWSDLKKVGDVDSEEDSAGVDIELDLREIEKRGLVEGVGKVLDELNSDKGYSVLGIVDGQRKDMGILGYEVKDILDVVDPYHEWHKFRGV